MQIRLSTLFFIMLTCALAAAVFVKQRRIQELQQKVEIYEEHLPEYKIETNIRISVQELDEAIKLYGPDHPFVNELKMQIGVKKREKKTEAINSSFSKGN